MQTFVKTTLAAALSIAVISPAFAGQQEIVVESQAAMQEWQEDIGRSLDRRLATAGRQIRVNPDDGIVQLRFTLDNQGNPRDIKVFRSSGDNRTDFVAKRAVSGLKQLNEAPIANIAAQTFQANIVFANTVEKRDKLFSKLAEMERARLASADGESAVISFGA